jgi:hypothetical protein
MIEFMNEFLQGFLTPERKKKLRVSFLERTKLPKFHIFNQLEIVDDESGGRFEEAANVEGTRTPKYSQ